MHRFILTTLLYLSSLLCQPSYILLPKQYNIKLGKVAYLYGASTEPDSNKHAFIWKGMDDFRLVAGGPVFFDIKDSNTIVMSSGRNEANHYPYYRKNLSNEQAKLVPTSFLNNQYRLFGVFEEPANKGSGLYTAFYFKGKKILAIWHQTIGFVVGVTYFSDDKENDFKNANFVFPYRNKIRF